MVLKVSTSLNKFCAIKYFPDHELGLKNLRLGWNGYRRRTEFLILLTTVSEKSLYLVETQDGTEPEYLMTTTCLDKTFQWDLPENVRSESDPNLENNKYEVNNDGCGFLNLKSQ